MYTQSIINRIIAGVILFVVLAAGPFTSASGASQVGPVSPSPGATLSAGSTIRINAEFVPVTLDPQASSATEEAGHLKLIYEGLTRLNSQSHTIPAAATSWMFSRDGKQITFSLPNNLHYSDGSFLNAKRFEYAILRAIDPTVQSQYASLFDRVVGATAYRTADPAALTPEQLATLRSQVQVKALDNNGDACTSYAQTNCLRLWISFTTPAFDFPMIASIWIVAPVKEELVTAGGANWWQNLANLVGNGPFILNSFNTNGLSDFVPNPNYRRGAPAYNLRYFYIDDRAQSYAEYKQGNLDITVTDPALVEDELKPQYHAYAGICTSAIFFHNARPPFTDPKIRAAFSYAFNREDWVREMWGSNGIPTLTWIPPNMPGYQSGETSWDYDPTKAVQALAESVYGGAGQLPPITVYYPASDADTARWQWLRTQWQTILGVTINLVAIPEGQEVPESMMYGMGWCGDYPDQRSYLSVYWHTGGFAQKIGFSNPQLDALLDQADVEMDPATRTTLYAQAQALLVQNVPAAFGWNNLNAYLIKPDIKGALPATFDTLWIGDTDPLTLWKATHTTYAPVVRR